MSRTIPNDALSHEVQQTSVSAYLRVVPNGVNDDGTVKLSVLLTPSSSAQSPVFTLENWPAEVIRALAPAGETDKTLEIDVVRIHAGTNAGALAPLGAACAVPSGEPVAPLGLIPRAPGFRPRLDDSTLHALTRVWRDALGPGQNTGHWGNLAAIVANSVAPGSPQNGGGLQETVIDLDRNSDFGNAGQIRPATIAQAIGDGPRPAVAAILEVPHADLALGLDALRVCELIESVWAAENASNASEVSQRAHATVTNDHIDSDRARSRDVYHRSLRALYSVDPANNQSPAREIDASHYQTLLALDSPDAILSSVSLFSPEQRALNQLIYPEISAKMRDLTKLDIREDRIRRREDLSASETLKTNRRAAKSAFDDEMMCYAATPRDPTDTQPGAARRSLSPGAAAHPDARETAFDAAFAVHQYATYPEYSDQQSPGNQALAADTTPLANACRNFFALQSNPVLARAFGLAFDVDMRSEPIVAQLGSDPVGFFYLRARFAGNQAAGPWTLAKWSPGHGGRAAFWPATEEELHAACLGDQNARGAPDQFEGFMLVSCAEVEGQHTSVCRLDLTSLDVRTATEMEVQRRQGVLVRQIEAATQSSGALDASMIEGAERVETDLDVGALFHTPGLTILNRRAQNDAARRHARRLLKRSVDDICDSGLVLDAADLTIGQRIHIGVPGPGWRTRWHNLMLRDVSYAETGHRDRGAVITAIRTLVGDFHSRERRALDAALVSSPSRLLPTGEPNKIEAVVEQALAIWDGGPLGVVCDTQSAVMDSLPFGRDFYPLTRLSGDALTSELPPLLRYGSAYRVAMAQVYSSGYSRRPEDLPDPQALPPSQRRLVRQTTYPAEQDQYDPATEPLKPFVRFLRQAKINAPQVLLPAGHADRTRVGRAYISAQNACGPMGYEIGRQLVVRSMIDANGAPFQRRTPEERRLADRATPDIAQRILVPAGVSFDEASRHGAFDGSTQARPSGAYGAVGLAHDGEGFPVTLLTTETGADGRRFASRRGNTRAPNADNNAGRTGDGIFGIGGASQSRFYTDPAADGIAMAIRLKGRHEYLAGGVYIETIGRPNQDARPVVLTVERSDVNRTRPVTHITDLLANPASGFPRQSFDPTRRTDIMVGSSYRDAHEVRLLLAPGEAIEIDVWSVPSATRLAREFALVESFARVLSQRSAPDQPCTDEAILAACERCMPAGPTAEIARLLRLEMDTMPNESLAFVGLGGIASPSVRALKAAGRMLHTLMTTRPLPEIAAPVRIDAVHAVNRVTRAPSLHRTESALPVNSRRFLIADLLRTPELRALRPAETEPPGEISVAAQSSTKVTLSGALDIDLAVTGAIEVKATMILPGSSNFDDPRRGRSLAQKRSGVWPTLRDLDGQVLVNAAGESRFVQAEALFGFQLASDGSMQHRPIEVTLLRADNLPLVWAGDRPLTLLDLFEEQNLGAIRISQRHSFVDGKARLMSVWINAISRTASMLSTVDRVATATDPWLESRTAMIGLTRDQLRAEPVPEDALGRASQPTPVILPSTERPAACDALAPVPVFRWSSDRNSDVSLLRKRTWQRREARIRIPLGRSWFSSGEDERLGIVLWPPEILGPMAAENENIVTIRDTEDDNTLRRIHVGRTSTSIPAFADRDLGPGGSFVSRRGGDPVRGSIGTETKTFLSPSDFVGVSFPGGPRLRSDAIEAEWVSNVAMPLQPSEGRSGRDPGHAQALPPLSVGLLLFKPRFDPIREEWYVDLGVRASKTAEPFLRLGLVRYQPNTVPELRCSNPISQWTQPLPERRVFARRHSDGTIGVTVWGQAPQRRAYQPRTWPGPSQDAMAADADRTIQAPRLRATMFLETRDLARRLHRHRLNTPPLKAEAKTLGRHATRMIWSFHFDRVDVPENSTLMLFLEEIERFVPASFSDEPLLHAVYVPAESGEPIADASVSGVDRTSPYSGDRNTLWRDAGARFTTTINLTDLAR